MVDPRLNSVHLEPPRRQEYRRAREALLNARGWHTLVAEHPEKAPQDDPHTLVHNDEGVRSELKFWLVDRDQIFPLQIGLNTIGRSPDNDVILPDAYISRRHCAILVHANDICELHDTASKNGTTINGRRLSGPTRLASGDEIRICDRQLIFITRDGAKAAPYHSPTLAG